MKHRWINQSGNERLLIFFNGWAMDEKPFAHLAADNIDVLMFYDYTSLETSLDILQIASQYNKVYLAAWSMGVWAASATLTDCDITLVRAVAINGTLQTISEEFGIAPEIFQGTIDSWSEASRAKFNRRMCGGGDNFEFFLANAPDRSVDSQLAELKALQSMFLSCNKILANFFTNAIIAQRDRIIPTAAQQRFWAGEGVNIIETRQAHYMFASNKNWSELACVE